MSTPGTYWLRMSFTNPSVLVVHVKPDGHGVGVLPRVITVSVGFTKSVIVTAAVGAEVQRKAAMAAATIV